MSPCSAMRLDRVVAASERHGKHAMTLIGSNLCPGDARRIAGRSVRMLVLGTHADLFLHSVRQLMQTGP